MKLLLIAATWEEVKPIEQQLADWDQAGRLTGHLVEISITGIGGAITAYHLGKLLAAGQWDLVIQAGIGGSFLPSTAIGTVVNVTKECFADLGAEDGKNFIDVFELGLLDAGHFPFTGGLLVNKTSPVASPTLASLPQMQGISVNRVHGDEESIASIQRRYQPEVESMEGASFFYCALSEHIPFLQLRAISNRVEKRNRDAWDIPRAIQRLNETTIKILEELLFDQP